MKQCLIVGIGSEIATGIAHRLRDDGWCVIGTAHDNICHAKWHMLIFAAGTMEPIGDFMDCDSKEWRKAIDTNAVKLLEDFRAVWPLREKDASVVFFSGPNPEKVNKTYSAYSASKALLTETVRVIAAETGERVIMFSPGVVNTKIHQQTLKAGAKAANLKRVKRIVSGKEKSASMDDVYKRLMEAVSAR